MPDYSLPREERLRSLKTIRRLFTEGRSGFVYPFRYMFFINEACSGAYDGACNGACDDVCDGACVEACDAGDAKKNVADLKIMFSMPKKFHKRANKRNLLKRRMREAYRLNKTILHEKAHGKSVDLALVYSTKDLLNYKTIQHAIRRILGQVSEHL